MHELGLCEAVVDAVWRRGGVTAGRAPRVPVGLLHHVHPEAFEQSFALAAAGTVAEGAGAKLVLVPLSGRCQQCSAIFETGERIAECPSCGSFSVELSGGDELTFESLTYRAPAEATAGGERGDG